MKNNMLSCERVVRIVAGVAITSLAFFGPANLIFLIGLLPVVTGIIGYCPAYELLKMKAPQSCGCNCKCGADKKKDGE